MASCGGTGGLYSVAHPLRLELNADSLHNYEERYRAGHGSQQGSSSRRSTRSCLSREASVTIQHESLAWVRKKRREATVVSMAMFYVRCIFQGRLHPSCSPVYDSKKSIVRFFNILILLKSSMRFDEGYGPSCDQQGCGKAGEGIRKMAIYRFCQCDRQCLRQLVPDCSCAGFERFACLDHGHELVAAFFKEADVGSLIGDRPMQIAARLPREAVPDFLFCRVASRSSRPSSSRSKNRSSLREK